MPRAPFGPSVNDPLTSWADLLAYLDAAKVKGALPRASESKALETSSQGLAVSFDMLPEFVPDDFPSLTLADTKLIREALVCPSSFGIKAAHQANIILCDLGFMMSLPLCAALLSAEHMKRVEYVFGACYPLKVFKAIIGLDTVQVIYFKIGGRLRFKGSKNQPMNRDLFANTVFAESNDEIAERQAPLAHFPSTGLPALHGSRHTIYAPIARNHIKPFKPWDIAPNFIWGLLGWILRGMINHTGLLIRLVMAQGVSAPLGRFRSLYYTKNQA